VNFNITTRTISLKNTADDTQTLLDMKTLNFICNIIFFLVFAYPAKAQLTAENYYYRGAIREFIGDSNGAEEDYNEAARNYFKKGCKKDSLGNYAGALRDLTLVVNMQPTWADAWYYRGMTKDNMGDHTGALKDLDKALELNGKMVAAYLGRGHVKNHLSDDWGAIKDYTRVLKLDPANEIALTNRGSIKQNKGKSKSAMKDYNRAIEINPGYVLAYFNRGLLQKQLGKSKEAIVDYDMALALCRANGIPVEDLCNEHSIYYKNQAGEQEKAIDLSPRLAMAFKTKTNLRINSCNEESLPDMNAILRTDKKNSEAYFKRAASKMEMLDYKGAINDFSRTIELDPANYFAYVFRGDMKCHSGDYWGAIDDYTKAIELNPKFADAWQNRGVARILIRQRDKACMDLSKAGELGCSNVYELIIKHCNP
jgi:tetratricopeptide (TPR) repeat protein